MRSVSLLIAAATVFTSSVASAETPSKPKQAKGKKADAVLVASAEPLPELPPPSQPAPAAPVVEIEPAASAPTPKDQAPAVRERGEPPLAGTGFVLSLGTGLSVLGGSIAEDFDVGAMLATFEIQAGVYVTPKFGLLAGVKGGYGALTSGCAGSCTNAFAYQFPLVAQYAFTDRSRGAYLEGGLALLTTYLASTDTRANPGASPELLTFSAPADFKLGLGYRVPVGATAKKAATSALDLKLGVDFGQFKSLEYRNVRASVAGDIVSARQAGHTTVGLTVGYHFSP